MLKKFLIASAAALTLAAVAAAVAECLSATGLPTFQPKPRAFSTDKPMSAWPVKKTIPRSGRAQYDGDFLIGNVTDQTGAQQINRSFTTER